MLIAHCERRLLELGGDGLTLGTAEPAQQRVEFYHRLGFRYVEHVDWPGKTYRSLILSKRLKS